MTGRVYGSVAVVCVAAFVAALVALHILDPGLDPLNEYMSVYGRREFGWLLQAGAMLLGVGAIANGLGLRATLAPGKRVLPAWLLMLVAGCGLIAGGLFITDPTGATGSTLSGLIHDLAGFAVLLSLLGAAWLLRGVFSRDTHYRDLDGIQLWFAVVLSLATVALFVLPGPIGLTQRILYGVIVVWLVVLATKIRRTADLPAGAG